MRLSSLVADTEHAPLQVIAQRPAEHTTFEPAPTACVHDAPLHDTLHDGPQVPVQVAPDGHSKRQPAVDDEQVSKSHEAFTAQLQEVPEQADDPQPM